ncbi:MAG: hybrid sensor histidine kinase/response regulator [Novosphingobium pentaromativorans]|uniref:histidine kinase n=2 Tax=Novosphingobium TaxID=165696 RepID=A0A2W5NF06_9SPHN|nr:MAG: hybrid sensor histidine kinase/response regulator [Novosphingobium pentaromativorans]
MRAMVDCFDWASTPLGEIANWPPELRASANLVLDSIEPTWLAWGPDLTFIFNDAYHPLLGGKPAALGRPLEEVWREVWPDVGALVNRTLAGESVLLRDLPLRAERGNGPEDTWFTFSYTPLRDSSGAVQGLYCAVAETTQAVRATQERDEAESALRDLNFSLEHQVAERTLERNQLWQVSHDLLLVADLDGTWLSINPAWTRCLGWSADELVGRTSEWMEHPDDQARTRAEVAKLAEGRTTLAFENRFRTRDGDYRTLSWTATVSGDRLYASARDVTDDRARAEALAEAEDQLRQAQKMEAVGQLTGGLAHDFNNLLAGISGSLELMNTRITQGRLGEIDRYMVAAQGATRRAAALTHRLLAFSRRQTLSPRTTNVNNLVSGMIEMLRRTVGPSIAVDPVLMSGLWPALVDASQLENALLNLCINARDAMPDGGKITIETGNRWIDRHGARQHGLPEGQYLSLCVSDTGTGMPADVIAKAFDPFFTTKPLGQGTGLGLSMIYGFAKQSGGQVRIYSEVGEGAMVCIYLPRHRGEADEDETLPDAASDNLATDGETVLVVDDEPTVRMLVADVLHELGYTAIEAADGLSGLRVLESDVRIDLLVSDVGLPGSMNGRQMADAARVHRPDLKVLFITGFAENALLNNGQLEPGMSVLTKPFAVDTLAGRIREMISEV